LQDQARPIILDPSGRWSCRRDSKVLTLAHDGVGQGPLWLVSSENASKVDQERIKILEDAGGELLCADHFWEDGGVQWGVILRRLWVKGIGSVMVEGGAKVIEDLMKEENQELVDRVIVTIAPVWLGRGGVTVAPERQEEKEVARLENVKYVQMGDDVVMCGTFKKTPTELDGLL
jgi:2,5-diamino-6-(ribosylamino)-4(3H)-pyrimidinone 5'-phosphate reductase